MKVIGFPASHLLVSRFIKPKTIAQTPMNGRAPFDIDNFLIIAHLELETVCG